MKRITNYALDCLINQGISKEHIKSLVKAIENQTRDNILTPEQAIEILLDGVIYKEELQIISKVPSKFWDDCMVIYTPDKYLSIDHAAKEWFKK